MGEDMSIQKTNYGGLKMFRINGGVIGEGVIYYSLFKRFIIIINIFHLFTFYNSQSFKILKICLNGYESVHNLHPFTSLLLQKIKIYLYSKSFSFSFFFF